MSEGPAHARRSRWARWRYRANLIWDRGTWPVLLAVGSATLLVVMASTAVLVFTNTTFKSEHGRSVAERFWQSLLRVIDPGTMASDVRWGPRLLSLVVTIFGIVLFGGVAARDDRPPPGAAVDLPQRRSDDRLGAAPGQCA